MRVKLVVPFALLVLSAGVTVIATPLAGLVEFTVRTYVAGGGGAVLAPPPPHAATNKLRPLAIKTAA